MILSLFIILHPFYVTVSPCPVYVHLSACSRCVPRQLHGWGKSLADHAHLKGINSRRALVAMEKSPATPPDDFPYLSSSNFQYFLPSSPSADDPASVLHMKIEEIRGHLPCTRICQHQGSILHTLPSFFVYDTETSPSQTIPSICVPKPISR